MFTIYMFHARYCGLGRLASLAVTGEGKRGRGEGDGEQDNAGQGGQGREGVCGRLAADHGERLEGYSEGRGVPGLSGAVARDWRGPSCCAVLNGLRGTARGM